MKKSKPAKKKLISDKKLKIFVELNEFMLEVYSQGHEIEAFIMAPQIIDEIMLPSLRNAILSKLGLNHLKAAFDNQKPYRAHLAYLALSHDEELFELLEKFRKLRNEVIHEVVKATSVKEIKVKAKKGLSLYAKLFGEIHDRETGLKPIPVLKLYEKGWKDCRKVIKRRIEEEFS